MDRTAWDVVENMTKEELEEAYSDLGAALMIIQQPKVRAMVNNIHYCIGLELRLNR